MVKRNKKTQQFVGRQGGNTPSFLKRQNVEESGQNQKPRAPNLDEDSSSDSEDQVPEQQDKLKCSKREAKQEQKMKVQESRAHGLPTGITPTDIEKFNALLRKHGGGDKAY